MSGDSLAGTRGLLLIVVNDPAFLVSHRLPVAIAAQNDGFEVHVASPDGPSVREIERCGLRHHAIRMDRSGKNPWREFTTVLAMYKLFWKLRPDIVHLVTPKPILYGGMAARFAPVRAVVVAISGLGVVFSGVDREVGLFKRFVLRMYRFAFGHRNLRVIFQNPADRDLLVSVGAVRPSQVVMIRGSGVDLESHAPVPEPMGVPVVAFAARLLGPKGVREFVQSAQLLHQRGLQARFLLAGSPDAGNPESISHAEMKSWADQGHVEVIGHCADIPALFGGSNLVVLPSYYGEGVPKVLLEAAACGRAVVTTDMPGCREAVEPDVSGVLVPAKDVESLANAIESLVHDPDRRKAMGAAGRALAEREFSVAGVVSAHIRIYRSLVA